MGTLVLISAHKVYAASVKLSDPSTSNISDFSQEFSVNAKIDINTEDGTRYFLRGVFFKEGTSAYCGLTWNGSAWFSGPYSKNEGWKSFFPVTVSSGSAVGSLRVKLDPGDADCLESGSYNFKIERFTQNGSSTFDSQNSLRVEVLLPTVTVSPVPTLIPSPTVKQQSAKSISPSKIPTSVIINSPTSVKINIKPTAVPVTIRDLSVKEASVLGELVKISKEDDLQTESLPTEPIKVIKSPDHGGNPLLPAYLSMAGGVFGVGGAVVLSLRKIKKERTG